MSETGNLLSILREAADARAVDAIEAALERGPDRGLCRINALAFADKQALDEEKTVSPSFTPPGSAFSTCPGTCSALVAAAFWTPMPR
jgi:hypothetical protein